MKAVVSSDLGLAPSELRGLTHEQIRPRMADDRELRAFLRRAIGLAMRPPEQTVAGDDSQSHSFH